jgi:bifunctional phosphoglucose/phosphomannose isomerase
MDSYLKHIREFQKQLTRKAVRLFNAPPSLADIKPDVIVTVGMGGSGLPGKLLFDLQDWLKLKTPVITWKNYGLPALHANRQPLFIFISFSGDTKETLSGLKYLLKTVSRRRKTTLAVVTSGGELKKIAMAKKLPLATFPAEDLTPREALGYNYFGLKLLLKAYFPGLLLKDFDQKIKPAKFEQLGRALAKKINGRVPIIYTPVENASLGYIWKINFNETAKNHAFSHTVPEAAHNEITAFGRNKKIFLPIFLVNRKTSKIIKEKIKLIAKVLKRTRVGSILISIPGKEKEEIAWNAIILSHFTSYYLAKLNKTDPTKTRLIDQLKKLEK